MSNKGEDYIIEFRQIHNSTKVSAVCMSTMIETSVIVPYNTPISDMKSLAIKKLEYIKIRICQKK